MLSNYVVSDSLLHRDNVRLSLAHEQHIRRGRLLRITTVGQRWAGPTRSTPSTSLARPPCLPPSLATFCRRTIPPLERHDNIEAPNSSTHAAQHLTAIRFIVTNVPSPSPLINTSSRERERERERSPSSISRRSVSERLQQLKVQVFPVHLLPVPVREWICG
ncbi:hypothetical protein MPTK1_6g21250 [Marchantia polymorpha subsp. ruderalis]|uniref:Uncharacterized protein n=2 Tax=Marchantia polymorpha TaxID=3197 RepID=A0AAF6BUG2_MARPO|nr:hypothetical protein MARPO_0091s0030 [Marchantia polymorpha]BBN15646.1 hypothetical protein Mp_6g21250 [Marchantia polymorpha subsp. ruderalis]|eukprot:PTQ33168.1 hypothetical protein MARPO_0091s0030 [Marchantia polymorpha]